MRTAALLEAQAASTFMRDDILEAEVRRNDRSQQLLPRHDAADEVADEETADAVSRARWNLVKRRARGLDREALQRCGSDEIRIWWTRRRRCEHCAHRPSSDR